MSPPNEEDELRDGETADEAGKRKRKMNYGNKGNNASDVQSLYAEDPSKFIVFRYGN